MKVTPRGFSSLLSRLLCQEKDSDRKWQQCSWVPLRASAGSRPPPCLCQRCPGQADPPPPPPQLLLLPPPRRPHSRRTPGWHTQIQMSYENESDAVGQWETMETKALFLKKRSPIMSFLHWVKQQWHNVAPPILDGEKTCDGYNTTETMSSQTRVYNHLEWNLDFQHWQLKKVQQNYHFLDYFPD